MRLFFFVFYQPLKVHTPQSRLDLFTLCKPPLTVADPLAKLSLEHVSQFSSFLFPIHRPHHVLLQRERGLHHEEQSSSAHWSASVCCSFPTRHWPMKNPGPVQRYASVIRDHSSTSRSP